MNNRLWNCKNPNQRGFKKVLCVCSAGLLRSPTAAVVLSQEPFYYNTRAVGLDKSHALIPVDEVLLHWADEIVCMTNEQASRLRLMMANLSSVKSIICLDIDDIYEYRDPELMDLIAAKYKELTKYV